MEENVIEGKKTSKSAEKKDEHDAVPTAWLVVDTDWQDRADFHSLDCKLNSHQVIVYESFED